MSRSLIVATMAAAALVAAPRAKADDLVRVSIPFAFTVDGRPLPAGEYRFELDEAARVVHVCAKGAGHVAVTTFSLAVSATREPGLSFHKHAGQRFLKAVSTGRGLEIALPETAAERAAEKADAEGRPVAGMQ